MNKLVLQRESLIRLIVERFLENMKLHPDFDEWIRVAIWDVLMIDDKHPEIPYTKYKELTDQVKNAVTKEIYYRG